MEFAVRFLPTTTKGTDAMTIKAIEGPRLNLPDEFFEVFAEILVTAAEAELSSREAARETVIELVTED
jgi:hypothetical protein